MAGVTANAVALVALLSMLVTSVYSTAAAAPSSSYNTSGWLDAKATWYGKRNGAGPDNNGGACNYKNNNLAPFNSMVSCGNVPIFKDGAGCGACYQIRCNKKNHPKCSNEAKTVVITDVNNGKIDNATYHFDLSGTAFGAMALPGHNQDLRDAGKISMQFKRVRCYWPGNITFYVLRGAQRYYLPVMPENVNGDGTVVKMEFKKSNKGSSWQPMYRSVGDVWRPEDGYPLDGPLSLRLTSESGQTVEAYNAIPHGWTEGTSYPSNVQFS